MYSWAPWSVSSDPSCPSSPPANFASHRRRLSFRSSRSLGSTKAFTNLASGWLADRHARRTTLLIGWLVALPVPLLILWAQSWWWIVAANAFLGINQGLTWSTTVIMKIDLVGPRRRGFAMGLNEFAGYLALAGAGILSAVAASHYGLRAGAAYPGVVIALTGLLLSWFVRETAGHVRLETSQHAAHMPVHDRPGLATILRRSMWSDAGLFSVSQAGLVNNLNDGLAWGVFPLLFTASGLTLRETSVLAAIYPATWGIVPARNGTAERSVGTKEAHRRRHAPPRSGAHRHDYGQRFRGVGRCPHRTRHRDSAASIRRFSPRSATSRIHRGAALPLVSTACGVISGTWPARCSPEFWPTLSEYQPRSMSSV